MGLHGLLQGEILRVTTKKMVFDAVSGNFMANFRKGLTVFKRGKGAAELTFSCVAI
jgi:hypothetical protein